jgi:CBS domain-containing protein
MSAPPVTIAADANLQDALEAMSRHGVSHLVVPGAGDPAGLVTDRDLRLQLPSRSHASPAEHELVATSTPVESICLRRPLSVTPETSLREVAQTMRHNNVGSVLVVDEGAVVGIITKTDFLDLLLGD